MLTEKFTNADVSALREELQERISGPFELAEILRAFLINRGYGVSSDTALAAASKVGAAGCSFSALQKELESVALVM
jgi:hypothetical protein